MHAPRATPSAPPTTVTLREGRPTDIPALYEFQCEPESCAMAMVKPRTKAAFDAIWEQTFQNQAAGVPNTVHKVILADGELCGAIGCRLVDTECNVGYALARAHWHRGIASRALALLLAEFPHRPIHARAAATNAASIRVLQKNGFIITGTLSSPETDRYLACDEVCMILT